jgi:hypothetical protein
MPLGRRSREKRREGRAFVTQRHQPDTINGVRLPLGLSVRGTRTLSAVPFPVLYYRDFVVVLVDGSQISRMYSPLGTSELPPPGYSNDDPPFAYTACAAEKTVHVAL